LFFRKNSNIRISTRSMYHVILSLLTELKKSNNYYRCITSSVL